MATELGKAYVQIVPSARGIKSDIEQTLSPEMARAGGLSGITLGKNIVGTLKKALAVAGVGKVLQSAMNEGAKLQQSYGGLETIYGEAAEAAKAYAEQAYAAGISANDYAEQAVSFGASLRQAFGGDTAKAVEAANTAIMDMTDNAAKMGTPLQAIQNAYQGFAKQNYTMLDNLKLGYGGTKKEMERLLKDAQKLSGVEYNIDNLGDVYEAIHVIQGELGLTGVAAQEAEGTFSGSFGAMRAALSNFMGALATGGDIATPLSALVGNIGVFLTNNLFPMLWNIISQIPAIITTLGPLIMNAGYQIFEQIQPFLNAETIKAGAESVTSYVSGLMERAPEIMATGTQIANDFVKSVSTELPQMITTGGEIVLNMSKGMTQNLPEVIRSAGESIASFLDTVLKSIPEVINSGVQVVHEWSNGMNGNKMEVFFAIYDAIKGIVAVIVSNLPLILEAGIKILAEMAAGVARMIPSVLILFGSIIKDIVKSFVEYDWADLGLQIIKGIISGLTSGLGLIADAAKSAASSAYNAAKDFLGIESPSKLFRDEVGAMMAEGMAIGFENNVPTAEIEASLRPMADVVPDTLGGTAYNYGGFSINIYGAPGQSVEELADLVGDRINREIYSGRAVFA